MVDLWLAMVEVRPTVLSPVELLHHHVSKLVAMVVDILFALGTMAVITEIISSGKVFINLAIMTTSIPSVTGAGLKENLEAAMSHRYSSFVDERPIQ